MRQPGYTLHLTRPHLKLPSRYNNVELTSLQLTSQADVETIIGNSFQRFLTNVT